MASDESPIESAGRELVEETGYEGSLQPVGSYFLEAYSTVVRHAFVATGCQRTFEPRLDSSEFVEVVVVEFEEFLHFLFSGLMTDSTAAFYALKHLNRLQLS